MKEFTIINDDKAIEFKFPTSMDEVSAEYLKDVTRNIHIADNYSLVGIIYHESLASVILARKQAKKSITSGVVPIFIKAGNTDNEFIQSCSIKDKIIIPSSQLNLGYHVACPTNVLSLDYFIRKLDNDVTVAKRYNNTYGREECFFIEFKIVPNCDIVGFYDNTKQSMTNKYINISSIEE